MESVYVHSCSLIWVTGASVFHSTPICFLALMEMSHLFPLNSILNGILWLNLIQRFLLLRNLGTLSYLISLKNRVWASRKKLTSSRRTVRHLWKENHWGTKLFGFCYLLFWELVVLNALFLYTYISYVNRFPLTFAQVCKIMNLFNVSCKVLVNKNTAQARIHELKRGHICNTW